MNGCIFCKIVSKEIPATIVYEDEHVIAFQDIHPQAPVHVLVIPKVHIESMKEINEENVDVIKNIHLAINQVAKKLGILEEGYRIINNCGENGGQTVPHLHYHLLGGKTLGEKIL